jgi:hypothetical protein
MSFHSAFNLKKTLKISLLLAYILLIFYLIHFRNISKLSSTILFIVLGVIFLFNLIPIKTNPLFKAINNDDLNKFKEYLSLNNLKIENIHKIEYISGKTPILYAIERRAFNIFQYLVNNNYDLKYIPERAEPIITFAAHSGELKYMELLLKNKEKIDLYAISKKFEANALEIAVWREKEDIVEALINAGMAFSIKKYNNTRIGKLSVPFENIPLNIKTTLLKRFIFNKTQNQLNMVYEINEKNNLKSFKDNKIYWKEYLQFA